MKLQRALGVLPLAALLLTAAAAHGQDGDGQSQWEDMPMASSGSDPRLERRLSRVGGQRDPTRHRRGPVGTLYVGVPLANAVDRDVVRPGGSIDFRGGYDFGFIVPEFEIGFMGLPIKASELSLRNDDGPLKQFYFGFGARLQIPNRSVVLPYLSGAFDFQFWSYDQTATVCDPWYCREENSYDFAPGFTGRGGLAFRITSRFALDVSMRVGMSFPGNVFAESRSWVQPSLGFTWWN